MTANPATINITDAAAARITALTGGDTGRFFRIAINGGGCSGFQYDFRIDDARASDDLEFAHGAARVVVDRITLDLMAGATVDFVDDLMGQAFRINNPLATASCGCGTSFSI